MIFDSPFVVFFLALVACVKFWFKSSGRRCQSKVCLQGKIALVIGGNSGLEYQIVLSLLSRGCKVIIADKIVDEKIQNALIKETKNPNLSSEYVNLASFKSVRLLAERLTNSQKKLDIFVYNTGLLVGPKTPSEDGLNNVMQVNYFSGFLLTHLLIDLLKQSSSGRIIFPSSFASSFHKITLDNIDRMLIKTETEDFMNYCNSKFCVIAASELFAEKLRKNNITSNTFHPGFIKIPILRNIEQDCSTLLDKFIKYSEPFMMKSFAKTAEEGAQSAIYLAAANEVENITGEYFWETFPTPKPKETSNKVLCSTIWKLTEEIVKLEEKERLI